MNYAFIFTLEAEADILAIWQKIARSDSQNAADHAIARIYNECIKLGQTPTAGYVRQELLDGRYRFWRIASWILAYRWQVQPIQIIAILHEASDVGVFLGRSAISDDLDEAASS